ncbi:hypothetical protein T484DRAFT_1757189 [Baffinella frigidus]|nr:hypothetical protein T484DRAFT_1757189 [Cryptophyta sp. CCMP2293]
MMLSTKEMIDVNDYRTSITQRVNSITRVASLVVFHGNEHPKSSFASVLQKYGDYTKPPMTEEGKNFAAFQLQLTTKKADKGEFGAGTVLNTPDTQLQLTTVNNAPDTQLQPTTKMADKEEFGAGTVLYIVNNALDTLEGIIDTHAAETNDAKTANLTAICEYLFATAQSTVLDAKLLDEEHPDGIKLWRNQTQLAKISAKIFENMEKQNEIVTTGFTTDHNLQMEQLEDCNTRVDSYITNWECQSYMEPYTNYTTARKFQDQMKLDLKKISDDLSQVTEKLMQTSKKPTAGMVGQSVVMKVAMMLVVNTHKCYMDQPIEAQQHLDIRDSICELVALITSPSGGSDLEIYASLKKHFTVLLRTVSGMNLTVSEMEEGMVINPVEGITDTHTLRIELRPFVPGAALDTKHQEEVEKYLGVMNEISPSTGHEQLVQTVPQRIQLRYANTYATRIEDKTEDDDTEDDYTTTYPISRSLALGSIEDTESTESTGDTESVPLAEDIKTAFHGPLRLDPIPSENNRLQGIHFSGRSQPTQQPTDEKPSKMAGFYAFALKAAGIPAKKPTEPHA